MLKHFQLGRRSSFPWIFITLVFALFGLASLLPIQQKNTYELLISVGGAAAVFIHFLYTQNHRDTQMFVSLFEKFNNRYNGLNEKLNAIISRPIDSPLIPEQIDTLYDYFNLSAEEHLFYEAGYIDEVVWQAWLRGMKHFAKDPAVLRLWKQEIASGSYYHFKLSLFDAVHLPNLDDRPVFRPIFAKDAIHGGTLIGQDTHAL